MNTKLIVINQILRQLTLHSHIATACKTPSSRHKHSAKPSHRLTQEAAVKRIPPSHLPFSALPGFRDVFPILLRKQTPVFFYDIPTENQTWAPGASRAGSSDCSRSSRPPRRPLGRAASGLCPGPGSAPRGQGGGPGLHNRGEGARPGREGAAAGAGSEERERERRRRRECWERFAPPHAQTLRGFRPCPHRRQRQPVPGSPRRAGDPRSRPRPRRPLTPLSSSAATSSAASPHLSNAPAHWATPPARSRAPIGRFPPRGSFPAAPQAEAAAPLPVRGWPR